MSRSRPPSAPPRDEPDDQLARRARRDGRGGNAQDASPSCGRRRAPSSRSRAAARSSACARTTTSGWPTMRTWSPRPPRASPATAPGRPRSASSAASSSPTSSSSAIWPSSAAPPPRSPTSPAGTPTPPSSTLSATARRRSSPTASTTRRSSTACGSRARRTRPSTSTRTPTTSGASSREAPAVERRLIVTDGVFSMEGDLAPMPELAEIAASHDATLIVDDSHGIGVVGETGRGVLERFGLLGREDIVITGTLGKALGGAAGGFVAGSRGALRRARATLPRAALLQWAAAVGRLRIPRGAGDCCATGPGSSRRCGRTRRPCARRSPPRG